MSWLNSVTAISSHVIKNFLLREDPNKVLDVKVMDYSERHIHCREDSLVLYAPDPKKGNRYELLLHRPCSETIDDAFSLCRSVDRDVVEIKFLQCKDKLATIVSICKDLYHSSHIQQICDTLSEHPTWSLAHLFTHLGRVECLTDPAIAPLINCEDETTGISPLQLAVQKENIKMVQALLNNNASLDHFDHASSSVLHYAARTNKQIVMVLCEKSKNTLNSRDGNGHTPLHVACYSDKRDCVRALLQVGADVNISARSASSTPGAVQVQGFTDKLHEEDMKYGGTPLHWAQSREVVEELLKMKCDINNLNFDQRTALHMMVYRNRLECVVALMSCNAEINIGDQDGNTPLHLAVQQGNEAIVKALVVFGADLAYKNSQGHSPRHAIKCDVSPGDKILYILHAVGAPRCPPDMTGCNAGCLHNESVNGTMPPPVLCPAPRDLLNNLLDVAEVLRKGKKNEGRLLCLDGGGIRGLVLVVILIELEKMLGSPIVEHFDWIAGTSTGGILAMALATKKTLQESLCLYFKMKEVAFTGSRPYASEPFENILKETFGAETTMSSIQRPKLIITTTLADRQPVDLHLFRNYPSPSSVLGVPHVGPFEEPLPPEEQLQWQAARATGAAPSYFRAFGKYLDGGLISNNPTLDALTEIQEYNIALRAMGKADDITPVSLVVSLGTGSIPLTHLDEPLDVFIPRTLWDAKSIYSNISHLSQVLVDQATQADGRVIDRARAWCSMLGIPFFRFSPQLSANINMDEKCDEKLTNMLWETKAYMHSRSTDIQELEKILKNSI